MSKGYRGVIRQGCKVIFALGLCLLLFKYGVSNIYNSVHGEKEKTRISIEVISTGEGQVKIFEGNACVLSGNGLVTVSESSDIKIQLTCHDGNLISYYRVNGGDKEFSKGQQWDDELNNLTEDTKIEVGFQLYNTIVIDKKESYELEVRGAEYCSKTKEMSDCYFYDTDTLLVKVLPKEYWLLQEIELDEKIYYPEELETLQHIENDYELSITNSIKKISCTFVKEKIPVTIKYGEGTFYINGELVEDGQEIDRCSLYDVTYIVSQETTLVNTIYFNMEKVELISDNDSWETYHFTQEDKQNEVIIRVIENDAQIVTSCRDYFDMKKQVKNIYWPQKYYTVYVKQKEITLVCLRDSRVNKVMFNNNITNIDNTLKINTPASIAKIGIKSDQGLVVCLTPLQFVYDGNAPTISNYSINTYPTIKDKTPQIDLTVVAKDSGEAGVDQILCGSYEEYNQWVTKVESGEYESMHEKAESQVEVTFPNQESYSSNDYYVWAIDCAANISAAVKLDLQGPVLQCSTEDVWHNTEFQVTGVADENIESIFYSSSYDAFLQYTYKVQPVKKDGQSEEQEEQYSGKSKSNAWSFTLPAKEDKIQTYYIWGYDIHGNKSTVPIIYDSKTDVTAPYLNLSRSIGEGQWSKDVIRLSLEAGENNLSCNSGIEQVYYSSMADFSNPIAITYQNNKGEYVVQSPTDSNGKALELNQKYYFWAVDKAGNKSPIKETTVQVDARAPYLIDVELETKESKGQIKVTKNGICSKEKLLLKVKAKDEGVSSGLGYVYLYQEDKVYAKAKGENGVYLFEISKPFFGEVSFQVEDGVGHMSNKMTISQLNNGIASSYVRLEDEAPQVHIECPLANYTDTSNKRWYKEDVDLTISYLDTGSGVQDIKTWINEEQILVDTKGRTLPINELVGDTSQYTLSTSQVPPKEDGSYHIKVQVTDGCGNISEETCVIYIDREAPYISHFILTTKNESYKQTKMVDQESYGYYFEEKALIRIQAEDKLASSGIQKIGYYTIDYGRDPNGIKSKIRVVETDDLGGIEIVLSSGFKGQIYAMALDGVGNYTKGYSKPYGIIIESVEANSSWANVEFKMPSTKNTDKSGNPLYAGEIQLEFTAQDYFNGIKKVEWQIESPQDTKNNQIGEIEVDSKGGLSKHIEEESITRDHNLVTSLKHSITICNNSNDISIMVKITDSTGHCFSKKVVCSIDTVKPELSFVVPSQSEAGAREYFNKVQLVELKVKERNFDTKRVTATILNDVAGEFQISPWREEKNERNPDETIHTATVFCDKDGAYSLKAKVEDMAGNSTAYIEKEFIIDTIKPEVELHFSGTLKSQGNYTFFREGQTASITIKEHNLDVSSVVVNCRQFHSLYNQKEELFEGPSEFATKGDDHIATLALKEDGWYTIEIFCKDLAGNELEKKIDTSFGIDTKKPEITVEGVLHQSANNGELVPVVTICDDNYESSKTKVRLSGSKIGEVVFLIDNDNLKLIQGNNEISKWIKAGGITVKKLDETSQGLVKGQQLVMNCFPDQQALDDLYTLTIEAEDTVGNQSSQSLEFSVNRYGSVYTFSSHLKQLAGTYVQSVGSVSFTETNVNSLVKEDTQVLLSHNGETKNLVENKDYTMMQQDNSHQWSQYIYVVKESVFQEEGLYTITVHSKDDSGNVNENDLASKGAEIKFGVDKTKPIIIASNIQENEAYATTSKEVTLSIMDNISLKDVDIYLNNKELTCSQENDIYRFVLPSSNSEQNIKIVALDCAGNTTIKDINHIYVTTNFWVRFFHNKLLVTITVFLVIIFILIMGYLLILKRKILEKHFENNGKN